MMTGGGEMHLVEMHDIVKSFGSVLALDKVSFQLKPGEIRALVGENGAGKSTLMNILYGKYTPTQGSIYVKNKQAPAKWHPSLAMASGIGMIHQHFSLIQNHTALENIVLPTVKWSALRLDWASKAKKVEEIIKEYAFNFRIDEKIENISIGERQQVEITKALFQGADIFILDEPTTVLAPKQIKALFRFLESLKEKNYSVILVTHKLSDVMQISDNITVLRGGKHIATVPTRETTVQEVAKMMVDREMPAILRNSKDFSQSKYTLEVRSLSVLSEGLQPLVDDMSFTVREGEILGVAGAAGNGQVELAEALAHVRKAHSGDIFLQGEKINDWSIEKRASMGIGYIPEDRHRQAMVADMSILENILMSNLTNPAYAKRGLINHKAISACGEKAISDYNVRAENANTIMGKLSGGNQQKVVLARTLMGEPKLIIACNPTRGLDFSATAYLRQNLIECAKKGVGILLLSDDLDELFELSDRLLVIFNGRKMGEMQREALDLETLGMMMAGVNPAEKSGAEASP